jgi:hypothetical protein
MERWHGRAQRCAQSGRVGSWGEQVLGKIASKMMVMIMLFFQSLARGRVDFDATGEHTSGVEARPARNGDSQVWSRRFFPKLFQLTVVYTGGSFMET